MTTLTVSGNASGAGAFRVQAPASASSQTLTLPDTTGTLYVPGTTVSVIQSGTALAYNWNGLTTNTYLDFTIPSWAKRVTVGLIGLSTNGTSDVIIQLGDAGGIEGTGYTSTVISVAASSVGTSFTAGFGVLSPAAATSYTGQAIISLVNSTTNTWTYTSTVTSGSTTLQTGGGLKSTSAAMTTVRVTTVGGANYFDAGSVNVLFE